MEPLDSKPKTFASSLREAAPSERGQLFESYEKWVRAGAKAQGVWAGGFALLAVSGFAAIEAWYSGFRSPLLLGACGVAFAFGVAGSAVAMQREKQWRRDNPWARRNKDR